MNAGQGPVCGIDFGTTRSGLSLAYPGQSAPARVGSASGSPIPSVVAIDRLTDRVRPFSEAARYRESLADTDLVIRSVKLDLEAGREWRTERRAWTATDIVTEILRELRRRADEVVGGNLPVSVPAVVATPVGFAREGRTALRDAARRAGFEVLAFVPESTAGLLGAPARYRRARHVVVADWGGGTLDVSALERTPFGIAERYTDSWRVGGDAIDQRIAEWVADRAGVSLLSLPARDRDNILAWSEEGKRRLTEMESFTLKPGLADGRYLAVPLGRADLRAMIAPVIAEAIGVVRRTVTQAGLAAEEVGAYVFIGGSAQLVGFRQAVDEDPQIAGRAVFPDEPDWLVADGTAALAKSGTGYVAAEGLGLLMSNGGVHPIIRPGEDVRDLEHRVRVGLVEDVGEAQIPLVTFPAYADTRGVWRGRPDRFTVRECLGVPVLGFAGEAIDLRVRMSRDTMLSAEAESVQCKRPVHCALPSLALAYPLPL